MDRSILYTFATLAIIEKRVPNWRKLVKEDVNKYGGQHKYYPDGSLQVDGTDAARAFERQAGQALFYEVSQRFEQQWQTPGRVCSPVCETTVYFSLSAFPERIYSLVFSGEWVALLPFEGHFGVRTERLSGDMQRIRRTLEWPINDLQVSVAFHRRLTEQKREVFAKFIGGWFASVRVKGMFDEGPVVPVSKEIKFCKKLAQFRIDASRSGQDTINWLIISLINFCEHVLLTDVFFTREQGHVLIVGNTEPRLPTFEEEFGKPTHTLPIPTNYGLTAPFVDVPSPDMELLMTHLILPENEISIESFRTCPFWGTYTKDFSNEVVIALSHEDAPKFMAGPYRILAEFQIASGQRFEGYVIVSDLNADAIIAAAGISSKQKHGGIAYAFAIWLGSRFWTFSKYFPDYFPLGWKRIADDIGVTLHLADFVPLKYTMKLPAEKLPPAVEKQLPVSGVFEA